MEEKARSDEGAPRTLPEPIELGPVWDELAKIGESTPRYQRDELDAFGSRGERYPELSPNSQSLLARGYQRSLTLRRMEAAGQEHGLTPAEVRRELSQGEWCSEYLLGSVFRLVRSKVKDRARGRFGEQWANDLLPEILADATTTVLEAAETFDPSRGPTFASWMAERLDYQLNDHLGKHGRMGSMPQAWERIARIAHHAIPELADSLGRTPSMAEIRTVLEERCRTWAEEHLSSEQQHLEGDEREQAIFERMRKQGNLKALSELPQLLAAMQREENLDATLSEDSTMTRSDLLESSNSAEEATLASEEAGEYAQVIAIGTGNLDGEQREMVLTYLGLGNGEGGTYKRVAQQFGVPDLQVRHLVRDTQARLRAPHAQYAHLAGMLEAQFEVESEEAPAKASLQRRKRTNRTGREKELLLSEVS